MWVRVLFFFFPFFFLIARGDFHMMTFAGARWLFERASFPLSLREWKFKVLWEAWMIYVRLFCFVAIITDSNNPSGYPISVSSLLSWERLWYWYCPFCRYDGVVVCGITPFFMYTDLIVRVFCSVCTHSDIPWLNTEIKKTTFFADNTTNVQVIFSSSSLSHLH